MQNSFVSHLPDKDKEKTFRYLYEKYVVPLRYFAIKYIKIIINAKMPIAFKNSPKKLSINYNLHNISIIDILPNYNL